MYKQQLQLKQTFTTSSALPEVTAASSEVVGLKTPSRQDSLYVQTKNQTRQKRREGQFKGKENSQDFDTEMDTFTSVQKKVSGAP